MSEPLRKAAEPPREAAEPSARPWDRWPMTVATAAGLAVAAVLLLWIGRADVLGAPTFAGRLTGLLFVLFGVLAAAGTVASFDYWDRRRFRYSGPIVLAGVLSAFITTSLLCLLWLPRTEFTPHSFVFIPLWFWSLWALWLLGRHRAWEGIRHPKGFTAGLTVTALATAVNLGYTTVYQPHFAPVALAVDTAFGTPVADPVKPVIHLPLTITVRNPGTVPAYALETRYRVLGRTSDFHSDLRSESPEEWQSDLSTTTEREGYADRAEFYSVNSGSFIPAGETLQPKEKRVKETVVQISRDADFNEIVALAEVSLLRHDRGRLGSGFSTAQASWAQAEGEKDLVACGQCQYFAHYGTLSPATYVAAVTRHQRYLTTWIELDDTDQESLRFRISQVSRSSQKDLPVGGEDLAKHNIVTASTRESAIPFAALLAAESGSESGSGATG
ncbi:hypothetical protein ABZ714_13880 [Streptomyces sp. NPDC006798]|uniref:hypothetical protein n=1 Tax=Streptomyces sp. NPDC006798 TaxID=3155462 RepID=UPI0033F16610